MYPESNSAIVRILRLIPNALVFAAIVGVGLWGLANDWKLPEAREKAEHDGWCTSHNVPSDICIECQSDLLPASEPFGWCRKHGVHECTLCNPELAQLDSPYAVTPEDLTRAKAALAFAGRPENGKKDKLHERRIQFANSEAYERAGIELSPAFQGSIVETTPVHGEITHDPSRVARVSARAGGSVAKVFKRLGDPVAKGEAIALVDAAPVGLAKADYQHWRAQLESRDLTLKRVKEAMSPEGTVAVAEANLREARIKLASARQALINLGFALPADDYRGKSDEDVAQVMHFLGIPPEAVADQDRPSASTNLLPIRSPIPGRIASRDVVAGEIVDPSRMLFEVVDNAAVWLTVGVRNEDVSRIVVGTTRVRFEADGAADEVEGPVSWVSGEADPKTRRVKVRVELPNGSGRLRANTFGHGWLLLRHEPKATLVPSEAVHVEGGNHYVFVRDREFRTGRGKGLHFFHVRTVRVGARDDRNTEIIAGVLPGELVATKNSTMLMAELLRGKIGEG